MGDKLPPARARTAGKYACCSTVLNELEGALTSRVRELEFSAAPMPERSDLVSELRDVLCEVTAARADLDEALLAHGDEIGQLNDEIESLEKQLSAAVAAGNGRVP